MTSSSRNLIVWLYFYEDFLAAYDPKLRKDYGVYYTPRQVVELQVRPCQRTLGEAVRKKSWDLRTMVWCFLIRQWVLEPTPLRR